MPRKRLPIGIQTFRKIREDDCYYVDKTGFALRLIEGGKYYFLSRPRRFGKSLFLDTLAELFAGNAPLFEGLVAHAHWDWGRRFPVIRLGFAEGMLQTRAELDARILEQLEDNERSLGISGVERTLAGRFAALIAAAHAQTGERVVVLVDEYDKPILDNLTRPDAAREMRDGLRNVYSVIKGADAHIRFAMLTGVSKFSKVSLFSGLNNLNDITLDPAYSAICGYTETDLDAVFAPELEGLDRDALRHWYNGYNWTGEAVYNPFDVLLLFEKRKFRSWWFETGTPRFLIDVLTERETWLPRLGALVADEALLSAFDVGHISTEALLFQTGYLTIAGEEQLGGSLLYRLRWPNHEVYQGLNNALLDAWTPDSQANLRHRRSLYEALSRNDFDALRVLVTALFDAIPRQWTVKNPIAHYEGWYASVFYAHLAALGLDMTPEDSSNAGRLDLAVRLNDQRYLFEFKVVKLAANGSALQQIKDRGYADKYRGEGLPLHLIGIEFSRERRTVVGFEVEHMPPDGR
jgi:hypothetical protein